MKLTNVVGTRCHSRSKDGTMSIRCPDCDTALLHQTPEEGASLSLCPHVRFRWDSAGSIEFCGSWDHSAFESRFLKLLENHRFMSYRADHEGEKPGLADYFITFPDTITDILAKIEDDSMDEVLCMGYTAHYPMGGGGSAVLLWGIKHDPGYRPPPMRRTKKRPKATSRKRAPRKPPPKKRK